MWFTPKTKLSCHDQLDQVWYMTKIRLDNDVTDRTVVIYAKNKIKLS